MKKIIGVIIMIFILTGCSKGESHQEEIDSRSDTPKNTVAFQEIDVKVSGNNLKIVGEAKSSQREFYYTLEQGDKILVEETKVIQEDEGPKWQPFEIEISLPKEIVNSEEAPYIHLYGKSDGEKVNPNYVPIDLNQG